MIDNLDNFIAIYRIRRQDGSQFYLHSTRRLAALKDQYPFSTVQIISEKECGCRDCLIAGGYYDNPTGESGDRD